MSVELVFSIWYFCNVLVEKRSSSTAAEVSSVESIDSDKEARYHKGHGEHPTEHGEDANQNEDHNAVLTSHPCACLKVHKFYNSYVNEEAAEDAQFSIKLQSLHPLDNPGFMSLVVVQDVQDEED